MMNKPIGSDLKALFTIQLLFSLLTGLTGTLIPRFVMTISGLDPVAAPVAQQAGGLALAFATGAYFSLRAATWEQVRIFAVASLVAYGLSLLGAFYYVVIVGVMTFGLTLILIVCLILTIGLLYAWRKYERPLAAHHPADSPIKSA
jgi:hypothetical protein